MKPTAWLRKHQPEAGAFGVAEFDVAVAAIGGGVAIGDGAGEDEAEAAGVGVHGALFAVQYGGGKAGAVVVDVNVQKAAIDGGAQRHLGVASSMNYG